jgi:hypothetical protein
MRYNSVIILLIILGSIRRVVAWTALCTRALVVNANWNADNSGWNVNANSVTNPNEWNTGNQVLSRHYDISPPTLHRRSFC